MAYRALKQFIIFLIFVLIVAGLVFLIYQWTKSELTCFDGIQNQGEEGIDCGGPCPPCQLTSLEEIKVLSVKTIHTEGNLYGLAAQIKNPNQNFGSGQIPYQFKLYDYSNNLIIEYIDSTFILPNQTKYLIKTKIESPRDINRVELSFGEIDWQTIEDYQPPQLVIQQKEYRLLPSEETGLSQARGVLINRSNFDFEKIDIDILLFNSSGRLVAINSTEISTLLAGQKRDFVVTWFSKIPNQITSVEMEPETNIFDPSNYIPAGGEGEKFQEY